MTLRRSIQNILRIRLNLGFKRTYWFVEKKLKRVRFIVMYYIHYWIETTIVQIINPTLAIQDGPFSGLIYPYLPRPFETWSKILPKLAGTYEIALQPVIRKIIDRPYKTIINIGSDEGYYAIGLAKLKKSTKVYAFDINQRTIKYAKKFAKYNNVNKNIFIETIPAPKKISQYITTQTFILCDCEGCEYAIIDPKKIPELCLCDMLIELHPAEHKYIRETLIRRFRNTHHVRIIDEKKVSSRYNSLLDLMIKKITQDEMRPFKSSWILFSRI